jgi:hypothetical protein
MTIKDELKRAVAKTAVIVACALLPAISSASQDTDAMNAMDTAANPSRTSGSNVYVVNGDVFVSRGKNPAHRVDENEAIASNTLVTTGENSSALLKFEDGQVVTMQPDSSFLVREYRYDANKVADSNIVFSMLKGGMRFITGLIGKAKKQAFRLAAPNATIGIRGTDFMVVMADKSMYSRVKTGRITMTNAAGLKTVRAGQSVVVASPKVLASVVSASAIPADTFTELSSIPVDPDAIPAPVTAPVTPVPGAEVGTAASMAESSAGAAGGLMAGMAGMAGSESEPAQEEAAPEPATPEPAPAQKETFAESEGGAALIGKIGTLGFGAELSVGISDNINARFGINGATYNHNATPTSQTYDYSLSMETASVLADWYPFASSFRTSGGLLYNNNQVSYSAIPTNGTYYINGVPYSTGQISSLKGNVSFNSISPYIGIGWGNPVKSGKGWGLVTDIGVIYQGSPTVDITATCSSFCLNLQSNAEAERQQIQDDLNKYKWWPVISIGASFQW